tara:strand:+ start:1756 stop:3060 length:1305 start_codon:yes stop_codon:yes gene_type:complete
MINTQKIKQLRGLHLSSSLSLSYKEPLHIIKGSGQYLYDVNGKKFLDAINNIQHVGHCHPKVLKASSDQLSRLNTNTRYLNDIIVEYAKSLSNKLPNKLDICFFTNSGSESNDLALRMARKITQSKETIVLDGAYHGHLSSLIEISPYKYNGPGGDGAPKFVHAIPMPNSYSGKYRGEDSGEKYINEVDVIIKKIRESGKKISAFIFESIMGCGGQLIHPKGFLKESIKKIKDAGGIIIADEVQIGFGRIGESFWGFESEDLIPDIVTMGKSMGNGHPLSALVTTRDISEQFNNGMEYFNSFGGNPVSCAIGHSVLNIIENEELQKNANDVGQYLKSMLNGLKEKFDLIGDVRGKGLFLGLELVRDIESLEPAYKEAKYIVNTMKEMGILISVDGPNDNVLKIKPPMIFNRDDALFLIESLDTVLSNMNIEIHS